MQKHYELTFIVPASQDGDDNVSAVVDGVKSMLAEKGAEITWEDEMGKRRFAYPIKFQHYGYYFIVEFDAEGEQVKKIDHELRLNADVLRYLMIQKTKKSEEELIAEREARTPRRKEREEEEEVRESKPAPVKDVALEEVPAKKEEEAPVEAPVAEEAPKPEEAPKEAPEEIVEHVKEETPEIAPVETPVEEPTSEEVSETEPEPESEPEKKEEKKEEEKVELSDFDTEKLDEILDKEIDI